MKKNKLNRLTANFLWNLTGVSPLLVIKIINDEKFLEELRELILKHYIERKGKK